MALSDMALQIRRSTTQRDLAHLLNVGLKGLERRLGNIHIKVRRKRTHLDSPSGCKPAIVLKAKPEIQCGFHLRLSREIVYVEHDGVHFELRGGRRPLIFKEQGIVIESGFFHVHRPWLASTVWRGGSLGFRPSPCGPFRGEELLIVHGSVPTEDTSYRRVLRRDRINRHGTTG